MPANIKRFSSKEFFVKKKNHGLKAGDVIYGPAWNLACSQVVRVFNKDSFFCGLATEETIKKYTDECAVDDVCAQR